MTMSGKPEMFSAESFAFLEDLKANNTKDWFSANKATYEATIKKPAEAFRKQLQQELTDLTGETHTSKIFRINRDLRFSKDKTPYNTHVRMAFWPDAGIFDGTRAQPPSFFLSIEIDHIRFGAGSMQFSKPALERYLSQLDTGLGEELTSVLATLKGEGFETSEPDLAKPPRTYPKDAAFADLSRHKGLTVWKTLNDTNCVVGEGAASRLKGHLAPTLPLWKTLSQI